MSVRLTVDLFTPVRTELLDTRSVSVRSGPRIEVIDSNIVQNGEVKARASALFVTVGDKPQGELWHSNDSLPDAPDTVDVVAPPVFKSGDGPWSGDFSAHQKPGRKSVWQNFPPLIASEVMSPFQRASAMAEDHQSRRARKKRSTVGLLHRRRNDLCRGEIAQCLDADRFGDGQRNHRAPIGELTPNRVDLLEFGDRPLPQQRRGRCLRRPENC